MRMSKNLIYHVRGEMLKISSKMMIMLLNNM